MKSSRSVITCRVKSTSLVRPGSSPVKVHDLVNDSVMFPRGTGERVQHLTCQYLQSNFNIMMLYTVADVLG
jgi:hypothetical protein